MLDRKKHRQALRSEVSSQTSSVTRDTVREEVVVAVHDTLREVTTITIRQNRRTSERRGQAGLDYPEREGGKPEVNEAGDTVKQSIVTDRYRGRNAEGLKVHDERLTVQRDTIYVEKRDSVYVQTNTNLANPTNKKSGFLTCVKWITALVCAIVVLVVVIRLKC